MNDYYRSSFISTIKNNSRFRLLIATNYVLHTTPCRHRCYMNLFHCYIDHLKDHLKSQLKIMYICTLVTKNVLKLN